MLPRRRVWQRPGLARERSPEERRIAEARGRGERRSTSSSSIASARTACCRAAPLWSRPRLGGAERPRRAQADERRRSMQSVDSAGARRRKPSPRSSLVRLLPIISPPPRRIAPPQPSSRRGGRGPPPPLGERLPRRPAQRERAPPSGPIPGPRRRRAELEAAEDRGRQTRAARRSRPTGSRPALAGRHAVPACLAEAEARRANCAGGESRRCRSCCPPGRRQGARPPRMREVAAATRLRRPPRSATTSRRRSIPPRRAIGASCRPNDSVRSCRRARAAWRHVSAPPPLARFGWRRSPSSPIRRAATLAPLLAPASPGLARRRAVRWYASINRSAARTARLRSVLRRATASPR